MVTHELKIYPVYFESAIKGLKPFEIRNNDRHFQVGDKIILREWDNIKFSGREIYGVITYILPNSFIGLTPGYVAFTYETYKIVGC